MKFRDSEVIGWTLVEDIDIPGFIDGINKLMEEYVFVDCQYSTHTNFGDTYYTALILLGEKNESTTD